MLGLTAVFAPSPLGGGARGAPPPHRIGWFCGRTRAPLQGVAWAGLWRGGEEGASVMAFAIQSAISSVHG